MGGPDVFVDESVWIDRIREVASRADDTDDWQVELGMFHRMVALEEGTMTKPMRIIPEDAERVVPYLQAIDVLWQLGDREEPGGFDRP